MTEEQSKDRLDREGAQWYLDQLAYERRMADDFMRYWFPALIVTVLFWACFCAWLGGGFG